MDSSFESLCSSQAYPIHAPAQQGGRPNFLATIRSLHRSLKKPLRLKVRTNSDTSEASQSTSDLSRGSSRSNSQHSPVDHYQAPRRTGVAPDMEDYLSLDQLEGLWQYQDSFVGPVATPLTTSRFNFQEAVEAPTIVHHKRPENVSIPRANSGPNLGVTGSGDAAIVDGYLHPAFRSSPNLQDTYEDIEIEIDIEVEKDLPPPPPLSINRSRIVDEFPRLSAIGRPINKSPSRPVQRPVERPSTSWTQRRQYLREQPGLI